jgi:hypothetical protein
MTNSKEKCGLCGKDPAEGFAMIGDIRYCHGDSSNVLSFLTMVDKPTCYMKQTWDEAKRGGELIHDSLQT